MKNPKLTNRQLYPDDMPMVGNNPALPMLLRFFTIKELFSVLLNL